jgi:hypothetical protein
MDANASTSASRTARITSPGAQRAQMVLDGYDPEPGAVFRLLADLADWCHEEPDVNPLPEIAPLAEIYASERRSSWTNMTEQFGAPKPAADQGT